MFIAAMDGEEWESYEKVRHPRFEKTDQIHMRRMSGDKGHKVVVFSASLQIKENNEIHLKDLMVLYGLESDMADSFDLKRFADSLKDKGWEITSGNNAEIVDEESFLLDWRRFNCPTCGLSALVFMLTHNYPESKSLEVFEKNPWCHNQSSRRYGFLHAYKVKTKSAPHQARELQLEELAKILARRGAVALTGAGLSLASGIPTFGGPNGFCTRLELHQNGFPDAFFRLLITNPHFVAYKVGAFQAGFIKAKPNPAHLAMASLEREGIIRHVITENFDALHQRAGSTYVTEIGSTDDFERHFSEDKDGWEILRTAGTLIVVGIGRDEHGLIEYARDNDVKVVAIGPARPSFLSARDAYSAGPAEVVLPRLYKTISRRQVLC